MAQNLNNILPEEKYCQVHFRDILILGLGTITLLFILNILAYFYLKENPINRGYWLVRQKWELLFKQNQPVDWLILGDSTANQGIDPAIIEQRLGGSALNLSTLGNLLALGNAWSLEKYLKEVGAPKQVLLVHAYDIWEREVGLDTLAYIAKIPLNWQDFNDLEPKLDLSWEEKIHILSQRYVPIYSENKTIIRLIKSSRNFSDNQKFQLAANGFMRISKSAPENVNKDAQEHLKFVINRKFKLSKINQLSLEKLMKLAEIYSFDIYIADSPIYQELYQDKEFQAYYNQVQQMLHQFANRSNRIHYVSQIPVTFSKTEMQNADHVIYSAAKSYTNNLVLGINQMNYLSK